MELLQKVPAITPNEGKTVRRWQARNMTSVICPICGQTYVMCSAAQKYCSSICRKKAEEQRESRRKRDAERKKAAGKSLEDKVAEAEKMGMSYGRYCAMQRTLETTA